MKHASVSPVCAALPGQAGDLDHFSGRLAGGPAVLRRCCGYGADLSVVGGVLVQVFDLQLASSHGHLIPEDCLVANNLLERGERERKRMKGNSRSDQTWQQNKSNIAYIIHLPVCTPLVWEESVYQSEEEGQGATEQPENSCVLKTH